MAHTAKKPSIYPLISIGAVGIVAIALVIICFSRTPQSYPLGDKLEYIGKVDYGCHLLCDSAPSATYYYATDMSADEVIKYFPKATVTYEPSTDDTTTFFGIQAKNGETVYLYYYQTRQDIKNSPGSSLKASRRPHILTIQSSKYPLAQSLL